MNLHRHRHGQSTLCSTARATLPAFAVDAALTIGYLVLRKHVLSGYAPRD